MLPKGQIVSSISRRLLLREGELREIAYKISSLGSGILGYKKVRSPLSSS